MTLTLRPSKNGNLVLPLDGPRTVRLRLKFPSGLQVEAIGFLSRENRFHLPRVIRPLATCEIEVEILEATASHDLWRDTIVIPLAQARFAASIRRHRGSLSVTVPVGWGRGMDHAQWKMLRVYMATEEPFTARLHRISRGTQDPIWKIPVKKMIDGVVEFRVERADEVISTSKPVEAVLDISSGAQDQNLLKYVDSTTIYWAEMFKALYKDVEDKNGYLQMQFKGVFRMLSKSNLVASSSLLGLYQAEGSKQGLDFHFSNTNAFLLRATADQLESALGLDRTALYAAPVYRVPGEAEEARTLATLVGVPVSEPRLNEGRGGAAIILTARNSAKLAAVTKTLLSQLVMGKLEMLPTDAVREFCIGFLDGDGNVTRARNEVSLRLYGSMEERVAVITGLRRVFGWAEKGKVFESAEDGHRMTMGLAEIIDLLDAGAFQFSMNRVRMLYALVDRAENIPSMPVSMRRRWGYEDESGRDTTKVARIAEAAKRYAVEISKIESVAPWMRELKGVTKKKGDIYPGLVAGLRTKAHQRTIRERAAAHEPRETISNLDGCRVAEIGVEQAESVILRYEWLGNIGKPITCYGLLRDAELLGVVTMGRGPAPSAGEICGPDFLPLAVCLERGACVHYAPKNAASFLIRAATKAAYRDHGWAIFFAYADEEAGEIGTVYQAANWFYLGKGLGRTVKQIPRYVTPDGETRTSRAVSGPRGELMARGWLYYPTETKHKYVWFEGKDRKKLIRACQYPFQPYPKRMA